MSYSYTPRTRLGHAATSPSPLRQFSTASNGSSTYSNGSNQYPPSRSSTQSSNASNGYGSIGHRRGLSEATALSQARSESCFGSEDIDSGNTYSSMRKALRPLQQAPQSPPVAEKLAQPPSSSP